jgi:hypothetical protein
VKSTCLWRQNTVRGGWRREASSVTKRCKSPTTTWGHTSVLCQSSGSKLIMPVNVLASEQTRATSDTAERIIKLLHYYTTHPEATLSYHASNMILNIHSDASYLSEREAKIWSGGVFYMGSNTEKAKRLTNREILIVSTILKPLNYGHSRNPRCAPAWTHGQIKATREPPN